MPRPNKVWFRKDIGWWMVTLAGEKVRLAQGRPNKKLAEQKLHELLAVRHQAPQSPTARVADVIESFLASNRSQLSEETMRSYDWYGQAFAEHSGLVLVTDLKPFHVTQFVTVQKGLGSDDPSTTLGALSFASSTGRKWKGLSPGTRCAAWKRPKPPPRGRAMTELEFRKLLKAEPTMRFKTFLFSLWATGCRPKEARTLTWKQVGDDRWVLTEHKTVGKTHKPRIIYLNAAMQKLMVVLRRESKSDFVFLNSYGKPWTANAVQQRIVRRRETAGLPVDVVAYLTRHAFGTNAIIKGVDVATVAELMGHTNLEMVATVYMHLAGQHKHLHDAVEKATTVGKTC